VAGLGNAKRQSKAFEKHLFVDIFACFCYTKYTKKSNYSKNIMAIEPQVLAELKEALLKEKAELEENLSRIAKPVDDKGDYKTSFEEIGSDREDNTTEVEQYADTLPVEITLEKKLQDIIEALRRMDAGAYGICENCHQEIDLERLKANPSAKTCIKCKDQSAA